MIHSRNPLAAWGVSDKDCIPLPNRDLCRGGVTGFRLWSMLHSPPEP
jgi:hypothetical protein